MFLGFVFTEIVFYIDLLKIIIFVQLQSLSWLQCGSRRHGASVERRAGRGSCGGARAEGRKRPRVLRRGRPAAGTRNQELAAGRPAMLEQSSVDSPGLLGCRAALSAYLQHGNTAWKAAGHGRCSGSELAEAAVRNRNAGRDVGLIAQSLD